MIDWSIGGIYRGRYQVESDQCLGLGLNTSLLLGSKVFSFPRQGVSIGILFSRAIGNLEVVQRQDISLTGLMGRKESFGRKVLEGSMIGNNQKLLGKLQEFGVLFLQGLDYYQYFTVMDFIVRFSIVKGLQIVGDRILLVIRAELGENSSGDFV